MAGQVLTYGANCFLLLVPVFIWNICLAGALPLPYSPGLFNKDVPAPLLLAENCLRLPLFAFPLIMRLGLSSQQQRTGLAVYVVGVVLYAISWLVQIRVPQSPWSRSTAGFSAPAYTSAMWLAGIGMIGEHSFIEWTYRPQFYFGLVAAFVFVHTAHAFTAYRNQAMRAAGHRASGRS
jgi:hypothetical protein